MLQLTAIRVPAGSVAAYQSAPGWSDYSNLIVAQFLYNKEAGQKAGFFVV